MTWQPYDARGLVEEIRRAFPAEFRLRLNFAEFRIELAANRREIVAGLMQYFAPFVTGEGPVDVRISVHQSPPPELAVSFRQHVPDPGKTTVKEEYFDLPGGRVVRKRLTGMVFVFGGGEHLALGPCLENLNQVVNFINNRYIEWRLCRGCLLGHAAAVMHSGRGLAVAGMAGAGKSTLALHLMSRGTALVSNDRLMIEPRGDGLVMHGVPKLPRINPGTAIHNPHLTPILSETERDRFGDLEPQELWELEHKYDVPVDECFGPDRIVLSGPMHGLVILTWDKEQDASFTAEAFDPAARKDLLAAFIKSPGLFFLPDGDCSPTRASAADYVEQLSRCRTMVFGGTVDFEGAARACLDFLETGSVAADSAEALSHS